MSDPKQVIILRKDLNMRKGKMVAQGAHASLAVLCNLMINSGGAVTIPKSKVTPPMQEWLDGSFAKICVSVNSEEELLEIYTQAKAKGIPCSLIRDAGRTEFNGVPTYTAVAIGPDTPERIDPITGQLPLL